MKRFFITLVTLCAGLLMLAAPVMAATPDSTPYHLCHTNLRYCVVPAVGTISPYESMFTSNTGNWYYLRVGKGTVSSSTFSNAGIDSDLIGDSIYEFEFNGNHSYCIGVSGGLSEVMPCGGGTGTLWVETPGNLMVNIYETNRTTNGASEQVMTGQTAGSATITTVTVGTQSPGRQEWVLHS